MSADIIEAKDRGGLRKVAEALRGGAVGALPFNGVWGLFARIEDKDAAQRIMTIKGRPDSKGLVATTLPEFVQEIADTRKLPESLDLTKLWKDIHALGVILPAADTAPAHLTVNKTVLTIWTEYQPLRHIIEDLRAIGGTALTATSANKTGEGTHSDFNALCADFRNDVEVIVQDDFGHLPDFRRMSTTLVDFTGNTPRLHRAGNVPEDELKKKFSEYGLTLSVPDNVLRVQARR